VTTPDLSAQVMAEMLVKIHGTTYAAAVALFDQDAPLLSRTELELRDRVLSELLHLDARTLGITPTDRSAA
jgi:hypothetical protein